MYGPDVAILLTYGSHDMRHTGFPQVDGGQRDPWDLGHHSGLTRLVGPNRIRDALFSITYKL